MDTINQSQAGEKDLTYWVSMAEALERLERNEDFKKVIVDGYFHDKAVSGVSILAMDQVKNGGRRTDVMEGLIAISSLQDHFYTIKAMGKAAEEEADMAEDEGNDEPVGTEVLEG